MDELHRISIKCPQRILHDQCKMHISLVYNQGLELGYSEGRSTNVKFALGILCTPLHIDI